MSITISDSTSEPRALSLGPIKAQLVSYTVAYGQTAGTVTADALTRIEHAFMGDAALKLSALPTFSGNVATLAFTAHVPAPVHASLIVQDITYTAVADDASGNDITIEYTAGGTAGSEVVTVTGSAISVQIEDGVSTATQVDAAIQASPEALLLVSDAITGTASNAQVSAAATHLAGGVTGTGSGTILCLGV